MFRRTVFILLAGIIALAIFPGCAAKEESPEEPVVDTSTMDPEMAEKVKWVQENCICAQCPSWKVCEGIEEKGGYCAGPIGKSECITEEKGCICPNCPVTAEMNLQHGYYCTRGSHEQQAAPEEMPEEPVEEESSEN